MPALNITDSSNIASLDSLIIADLCAGEFYVSLTPSVFIGSGANNVLGASIKIINPFNVVIKDYPSTGYDIVPPMTGIITVDVPVQASNYQYGNYTISVLLTDSTNTQYSLTKIVVLTQPDQNNKTVNYGSLSAQLNGVCKDGVVYIIADTVPVYSGVISDSQVNAFTLEYPTSSGKAVLSTSIGSFTDALFEGIYKFNGTICADYPIGDNVFVKINYQLKKIKNILCSIDEGLVLAKLASLDAEINSDCTDAEIQDTVSTIITTLRLLKTIEVAAENGFDASDYIAELETVLGMPCNVLSNSAPIINQNPNKDFNIVGRNVTKTTVGLTDTYTINNDIFTVAITPNGGALTITSAVLNGVTQTQTISLNLPNLYTQIKGQIVNSTEYSYWASIINKSWDSLDISCLSGITSPQWASYTYTQRSQVILAALCAGGSCNASIVDGALTHSAANVTKSWGNVANVYEVYAYLDGQFNGSVLYPATSYTFIGAADGSAHTFKLIAKCSNGLNGSALNGNFTYYGCPAIAAPIVSINNITSASCPYNLTLLVSGLPTGITAEWHNLNNTSTSSLVPDATQVQDGSFFVFGKNSDGCYSLGVSVIVSCSSGTNCSAPQNLIVEAITGAYRIRFQSAAYPPPLNSYTVKRRLTSDPDVSGSYTTLATPTYNSGVARWEVSDATGTDNTQYTYRAISNCSSTSPYSDYNFANIICPVVTLTPTQTEMGYSFTNSGGGINKYDVKIYDNSGISLLNTNTITPAFSTPITGIFTGLTGGTSYKVNLRVYIGTYFQDCSFTTGTTVAPATLLETGNTNTGVGGTRTQIAQVGASVVTGDIYQAQVYSHMVSYTAIGGDTPTTVATALTAAINATSEGSWNSASAAPAHGTVGFPPAATSSADSITIALDYAHSFAFNAISV